MPGDYPHTLVHVAPPKTRDYTMAKRKKKKSKAHPLKAESLVGLSPEKLMEKGTLLLKHEKFQDAIAYFKHLYKQEERVEFLQALEQAYHGRIGALAAKSMIKEAFALLDILLQRFPDTRATPLQLSLLLQAERYKEAARLYNQTHDQLPPKRQPQIESLFGALLLASNDVTVQDFEADSPLVQSYPQALAAIDMFCTGRPDELREALRQIPIRSPYRDLRILLNGLHHFLEDKVKGRGILRKIASDSPYYHSAVVHRRTAASTTTLLANLAATPKADHSKLPELHGLSALHVRVLKELAQTSGKPMDLYHIVRKNERCFSKGEKFELYQNIIPLCQEEAIDILQRSSIFNVAEKYRLCALAAELDNIPRYAVDFWSDYLQTISDKDPARHQEIGMIIRRQATLMEKDRYTFQPKEIIDAMLKSLEFDPGHPQTWLNASEYARRYQGVKQHYAIIQDAVQKLPAEVSILLAAMAACRNRGAYKKAAGLAAKVLALDPINTTALDFLVASRLEHGRKLASRKKWALAEKEVLSANTRTKSFRYKGRGKICLGMLLLLQNDDTGFEHIDAGLQENPYPLLGHVLVALEARLYGLTKARHKKFDNLLKQHTAAGQTIEPTEFHRLISWILDFDDKHWPMLKEICQLLKGYFAKAATLDLSVAEGLSLCRALEKIDLPMALFKCAKTLEKNHLNVLEFSAWYLLASAWKENRPMTFAAYDEMEDLFDELIEKQQFDFVEYIENIIDKRGLDSPHYFDYEEDDEDEFFIDFGPFGPPKIIPDQQKQKTPSEPKKRTGKQLNLFDDES